MSGNLSFTQELRKQGLIAEDINNDSVKNNKDKAENTEETVIIEETNKTDVIEAENIEETESVENIEEINDTEPTNYSFSDSVMFIGKKPAMNYVLAINSRMLNGLDKVTIKSRGKTISKAVDVAEIVTNRFITDANDDNVKLSTEEIFRDDGTSTNVSTIEIIIQR